MASTGIRWARSSTRLHLNNRQQLDRVCFLYSLDKGAPITRLWGHEKPPFLMFWISQISSRIVTIVDMIKLPSAKSLRLPG